MSIHVASCAQAFPLFSLQQVVLQRFLFFDTVVAMGSFDPSDLGRAYFYCRACPRAEQCSAKAWKRASIWGWSEDECRKRLQNHLASSSLHKEEFEAENGLTPEEEAAVAEVVEATVTESDVMEPLPRRQSLPTVPKRKAEPVPPQNAPTSQNVVQQVIQQLVQRQSDAASSDGSGNDQFTVMPYSRRSETVTLRVLEIQRCHDALVRASKAARHAQKLTASASTAFANEA